MICNNKIKHHTYSNGIPRMFMKQTKKLSVFQWYSMYFHTKASETIRFPVVFHVFQAFRPLETDSRRLS